MLIWFSQARTLNATKGRSDALVPVPHKGQQPTDFPPTIAHLLVSGMYLLSLNLANHNL